MTRHTRAHGALAGDRPESPTCKCFIALTHYQHLKRETEIQTEFTVPNSHQLQASDEARAFLIRESTSRGKQEEEREGPGLQVLLRDPLLWCHTPCPQERSALRTTHTAWRPHCARLLSGVAGAWLTTAPTVASGSGLGPHLQNRDNAQLQPLRTHWARLSPQPVLGEPPRAGT